MYKISVLFLFFVLTTLSSFSAPLTAADSLEAADFKTQTLNIPPLDTLYAWAEEHSFTLKVQDAIIEKTGAETNRVKKQWLDAIKVNANFKSGSYGNTVVNQMETGYSFGPNVTFSLYEIAAHKNMVQSFKADEKMASFKREELRDELHKIINILYTNIQLQSNILRIRSETLNTSFAQLKMAEKGFNQGSIELGEVSRVHEIYSKARVDHQIAIHELKTAYMELEERCGHSFN